MQVVAGVKAEVRREARNIEAARDGIKLLRPEYDLAKVELEIARLERLQHQRLQEQAQSDREAQGRELALEGLELERQQGPELERDDGPGHEHGLYREPRDKEWPIPGRVAREAQQLDRQQSRDERRLREAQELPPRDFLEQYAKGREIGAREPRSWDQLMRSSPQFVAMVGRLDQAERQARDLAVRMESERKAHPVRAALGVGESAKLGKELVETQEAIEKAKAKLEKFEKNPKAIGVFKAKAVKEAKGIMAARHETKLLRPMYEQALEQIKVEREQQQEHGLVEDLLNFGGLER